MRRVLSRPDLLGSLLAVGAVGALALGAVQGPVWGWGDPRTIAAFAGSALLAPLLLALGRTCRAVLELALFRVRSFSTGNVGALLLGTSFFGLVLANSLYLTQVWGYSVLRAGSRSRPGRWPARSRRRSQRGSRIGSTRAASSCRAPA
jgi:hypothetical protein